jgi:RNA-directed DNA polymerase
VETGVKPPCRGEAVSRRYADDGVCALQGRREAAWFDEGLPTRRGTCPREGSPGKTRIRRGRRVPPGMTRRGPLLGVEGVWQEDRPGGPRVKRRTARKQRQRACHRLKDGMQANRPVPGRAFVNGLKARLRGHERDDGVHGHAGALSRFVDWALTGTCTWRHRRGGHRRRGSWARFTQIVVAPHSERPRLTEVRRRRGLAGAHVLRGRESNRGTGCGTTARPALGGGRRGTGVPTAEAYLLTHLRHGDTR